MWDQESGRLGATVGTAQHVGPDQALGPEPKCNGAPGVRVRWVQGLNELTSTFPRARDPGRRGGCAWTQRGPRPA